VTLELVQDKFLIILKVPYAKDGLVIAGFVEERHRGRVSGSGGPVCEASSAEGSLALQWVSETVLIVGRKTGGRHFGGC